MTATPYRAATIAELGEWLGCGNEDELWRHVYEFLNEYWHEPPSARTALLTDEPATTGSQQWDVFLAALAEHLTTRAREEAPGWVHRRVLDTFWFPFNTPYARAEALVHAPAAFRKHGVFVAYQDLEIA
jgi:hypothetical protein